MPSQPEGTEEVRLQRWTSTGGNVLQTAAALIFASYFFYAPIGFAFVAALSPRCLGILSWRAILFGSVGYTAQLVAWKPHVGKGWPTVMRYWLYGRFTDWVLRYYDATCIREGPKLDPNNKYLFAMYPHGVYAVCRAFSGGVENWRHLFPGIFARWGSFGAAFFLPGIREFSLMCGCLDASKPVLERAIRRGDNIILLPGGLDEMALTDGDSKETKLVTLDRKGYAKLAIENGMHIVPGLCFGEKWVHKTRSLPPWICKVLRKFRMSGTFVKGRGLTFLGYLDHPLGFVWTEPVQVKQQKPVDPKYLDEVHAKVEAALQSTFERYKERFGYAQDETLTLVSAKPLKETAGKRD